ncbi:response regulator [uncultured Treponema sp.]|uniref:response regulator n=1 Tax=uncultured Treponema sp. TaxID=162155 RepID=UPI0025D83215|nr:response regulator [uncultured Treponema sp.]
MKKILLVTDMETSILIRSMIESFNKAGFDAKFCPIDSDYIKSNIASFSPDVCIIYMNGYSDSYTKCFKNIKDYIDKFSIKVYLYLIGTETEFTTAFKNVEREMFHEIFMRPVNVNDIIRQINLIGSDYIYSEQNLSEAEVQEHLDWKKILVVDDDSIFLRNISHQLSKDFNVYMVSSGTDAVGFLKNHTVDLILLDYEMPVLSGLDVLQLLRNEPTTADIPVIFLTGKDDKKTVMSVIAAKPDSYMLKSTPPIVLTQNLRDFFAKRK